MICLRCAHPPIWSHLHGEHPAMIIAPLLSLEALKTSWGLRPGSCGVLWDVQVAGQAGGTWGQPPAQGVTLWVGTQVWIQEEAVLSWEFKPYVEKKNSMRKNPLFLPKYSSMQNPQTQPHKSSLQNNLSGSLIQHKQKKIKLSSLYKLYLTQCYQKAIKQN